jgi:hypothetical protein
VWPLANRICKVLNAFSPSKTLGILFAFGLMGSEDCDKTLVPKQKSLHCQCRPFLSPQPFYRRGITMRELFASLSIVHMAWAVIKGALAVLALAP